MKRRTLFGTVATVGSAVGTALGLNLGEKAAQASTKTDFKGPNFKGDVEPRGTIGQLERLPSLDLESRQDFLTEFRQFVDRDLTRASAVQVNRGLLDRGLDPNGDPPMEQIFAAIEGNPVVGTAVRCWISCQQMTWSTVADEFHGQLDRYLDELDAADKAGPGTLELNPDMDMPDHVKHEIHIQPGGYVGDPLGGYVYHYGTNNFYKRRNHQDEVHAGLARSVPKPADGKVKRILELGCSTGQMAVALKRLYPDAEIWGIDIGAPLVRYAHMRAVELGVDVNFAQRLAEDTKFPDGHFDIVTSYILFHEMPAEISRQVVREAHRILRPGGVFFPIDFYTGSKPPSKNAAQKLRHWWDHRWNNEVWWQEYTALDLGGAMADAGFTVDTNGPRAWIGNTNLLGTKPG
ncbi:MAG: class I SAM-dependent methyltransferase [Rhodobacteraceae bacterium]|nr:class I SAM-dependent methyltransferase [Paracoccaceae bacterium]